MKGIILAGGEGTRLYPSTIACSKQILTIYDKPMIYYPMSILMLAGITEILIISTPRDINIFKELFDNGSNFGISISYAIQTRPRGIADAFIVGENFIKKEEVCLILGDNFFYGNGLSERLISATKLKSGAIIFGYHVNNPNDFGVVEFDDNGVVISIEEKPKNPKSNYAIPGLYFYDNNVVNIAKTLNPSKRGELEITEVNNIYLQERKLKVELFGRGIIWFDTGTHRSMLKAANFVEAEQMRQGLYIACLEEIAYRKGFISREKLLKQAERFKASDYGRYLYKVSEDKK